MWKLFTLLAVIGVSFVNGWEDCGSEVGSLVSLNVSDCEEDTRCVFKRKTNETISLQFKSNVDSSSVSTVVHGIILGVPVPFKLPNEDGCVGSGVTCPLVKGNTYSYTNSLPVLQSYPRVTVDVKWELKDQDGKDLLCVIIPAKIQ